MSIFEGRADPQGLSRCHLYLPMPVTALPAFFPRRMRVHAMLTSACSFTICILLYLYSQGRRQFHLVDLETHQELAGGEAKQETLLLQPRQEGDTTIYQRLLCADGQLDLQKPSGLALLLPRCKAASCAYQPKNRRLHRFICIFVPNLCVTWMPTWEDSQWQQLHALCVLGELINRS